MRVLIFGSRAWPDKAAVRDVVAGLSSDAVVVSGMADGPDTWAAQAAYDRGLFVIEVAVREQHWARYGRSAGPRRNMLMASLGLTHAIGFSTGSRGTEDMAEKARRRGIPVELHTASGVRYF